MSRRGHLPGSPLPQKLPSSAQKFLQQKEVMERTLDQKGPSQRVAAAVNLSPALSQNQAHCLPHKGSQELLWSEWMNASSLSCSLSPSLYEHYLATVTVLCQPWGQSSLLNPVQFVAHLWSCLFKTSHIGLPHCFSGDWHSLIIVLPF